MGPRDVLALGFLVLLAAAALGAAQTPSPPATLIKAVPKLFLDGPDKLNVAATTPGACGSALSNVPGATAQSRFTDETAPFNGSYRVIDRVTVKLVYTGSGSSGPLPSTTTGFDANVQFFIGTTLVGNSTQSFAGPVPPGSPISTTHNIAAPGPNTTAANGTLSLQVDLAATGATGGLPASTQNIQIDCGNSTVDAFRVARGAPGEGDLDGDGTPDSEDSDADGDGVPNAAEANIACTVKEKTYDFAQEKDLKPGDNDYDKDGFADETECAKGSDPKEAADVPPPPPQFPWGIVILGALVVLLAAALVAFFLFFGRVVSVRVLSAPQLVVPPGEKAKYQLEVASLRKSGAPVNFQLAATGLPEGWDAKLSVDHAMLDPVGGAKSSEKVLLSVEAPEHQDPESAVVWLRAIPLGASGRKDTFKLPASASTVTSINVPPNAVVPVKRGAPVKLKSEKQLAADAAAAALPVSADEEEPATPKKGKKGRTEPAPAEAAPAPAKPQVQVGGLQHSPAVFKQGEDVKTSVTVTNNGGDAQTLKLSLFVNEALADAQTVSVKPGKSREVKFRWTAQERNKLNIRGEVVPS